MTSDPIPQFLSLVESDAFCDCGYNLHGQKIWRDERLSILICRCPECGRHAAAGRFTGIHAAWLHRLSMGLILSWVLFLAGLFIFLTLFCGIWPNWHISSILEMQPVPGTSANYTQFQYEYSAPIWRGYATFVVVMISLSVLTGFLIGAATAVFTWHLKWRAFWMPALPWLALLVTYLGYNSSPMSDYARSVLLAHVVGYGLLESASVVVGICFGRQIARGLLSMLLPPRVLQHLAFLWYRDGKQPPKHSAVLPTSPRAQGQERSASH